MAEQRAEDMRSLALQREEDIQKMLSSKVAMTSFFENDLL